MGYRHGYQTGLANLDAPSKEFLTFSLLRETFHLQWSLRPPDRTSSPCLEYWWNMCIVLAQLAPRPGNTLPPPSKGGRRCPTGILTASRSLTQCSLKLGAVHMLLPKLLRM